MSILYKMKDRVAHLTLNRPEAMNAIDREMFQGIQAFLEKRPPIFKGEWLT